jgi:hypothetical protein
MSLEQMLDIIHKKYTLIKLEDSPNDTTKVIYL